MLALKKHEVRHRALEVPRKRRRVSLIRRLIDNRMICVLLLASAVCAVLTVYVSAYARVAEEGYRKVELVQRLQILSMENEDLRAYRDDLLQPARIAEFAIANGMKPSDKMAYVRPVDQTQVARNAETSEVR